MDRIATELMRPRPGTMSACTFYLPNRRTPKLFYEILIPLDPFDSGLDYEPQPVETRFSLKFLRLPVRDWRKLDGQEFRIKPDKSEGSIYLGAAHNPVEINRLQFTRLDGLRFRVELSLWCNFDYEGVAEDAEVDLTAEVEFIGLLAFPADDVELTKEDIARASEIARQQGKEASRQYLREIKQRHEIEGALEAAARLVDVSGYTTPVRDKGQIIFKPKDERAF